MANLIGTKWLFNKDLKAQDYKNKVFNFVFQAPNYAVDPVEESFTRLEIKYNSYNSSFSMYYGSLEVYNNKGAPNHWGTNCRIIRIIGDAIDNDALLGFLTENAVQIEVEDLTGTTWELYTNNVWCYSSHTEFNVNFTCNSVSYDTIYLPFETGAGVLDTVMFYNNAIREGGVAYMKTTDREYITEGLTGGEGWYDYDTNYIKLYYSDLSTNYRVIFPNSNAGTDATNLDLLFWFYSNATLKSYTPKEYVFFTETLSNATYGDITLTLQANQGYQLPNDVTVRNATKVSYNKTTGTLVLRNVSYITEIEVECTSS